jgi:DNA-directed RNA polymerase specialized sigma24 family protein
VQVMRGGEPAQLAGAPRSTGGDSRLARQAQDEGVSAFEYLCQRHVGPAWDLAYAVTGHRQSSAAAVADAFVRVLRPGRPARFDSPEELETALLTATRVAAIEAARRPDTDGTGEVAVAAGAGSELPVVSAAYRSLPERWRSVLWLTEVRHASDAETAAVLGVSGNGLVQLSFRARSGLRERVGDDLHDRDDIGAMLAPIAVPVPPTLVSMATSRWKAAANTATVVSRARLGLPSFPTSGRKPVAGAALAVMGLGIIGAAVVTGPLLNHGPGSGGLAPAAAAPTEVNQAGATGGQNPFLLSGSQTPVPPSDAPTTSTTAAATTTTGATTATTAAAPAAKAPATGGQASTAGLLPSPSSPTTTIVPSLPAPLGSGVGGSPLPVTVPTAPPPVTTTSIPLIPKLPITTTLPKIP